MAHDRKVLERFPFLENNSRWAGAVEVVHRTSTFEDSGNSRQFIDLSLKIGDRFMNLPIKDLDDVIKALQAARPLASEKLQALLASQPRTERPQGRGDNRGGRGDGRQDRRHHNRGD